MRKEKKKQAQEFIKVLWQAYEETISSVERQDAAVALDLLEQCHQGAIELGTMIEDSEGEGFVTVKMLEAYCELIYQAHEALLKEQAANFNIFCKNISKQLTQIENSVDRDIKVRKEAVFLPYKASMWDSLESVFRAADEDPECDAYVIPIPYYDKNPDGSFKAEHYEGDAYPDDVPITHYNAYDFKARHPDMIFIHNPYDEHNYVTSVHPFFYSKNLKQYTDRLVYIPYFVMDEIDPEDKEALEKVKQFCLESACLHAHKVIVQSENIRQAYINVLTEAMGEHTRSYWEEKIEGLGSPKMDRVVNVRREDIAAPKDWLKLIEKPDGSRRKIVFYNISLTTLLDQEEKMLRKVRDVLRVFKENQEDVVLLWRPHPLMRETIESMRPHLLAEYDELIASYRKENWGIYDDTADVERAIAISDAYYGTHSSVVKLYEATGKPIMIQNSEVLEFEE